MPRRKNIFREKKLYSVFFKVTELRDPKIWDWLRKSVDTDGRPITGHQNKLNSTSN